MKIKKIAVSEADEAMALVWKVFSEYEAPEYSSEGVKTFEDCIHSPNFLGQLEIFCAYEEDSEKLIGVLATRKEGSHIALFFVDGDYHRQGVGRALFEKMLESGSANRITVNSSPYAVGIYKKLGFITTDTEQLADGIRFTPMVFER